MRHQGLHAQLHQGGRCHCDHDDVVGRGGDATAHQDADRTGHDQGAQQRQRLGRGDGRRDHRRHTRSQRLRRAGNDEANLEAYARECDDADHNAYGRRCGAHRQRIFGTCLKGFDQRGVAYAPGDVGKLVQRQCCNDAGGEQRQLDLRLLLP